ncbi:MAG: hypothetical protein GXO46_02720 [Chlorobi bacterium]|nr:hypothetical protein [Chlorobiota bacterium]
MKIKILGILLISQFCYSQNIVQTDIQGKKLNDFVQLENKLGSKVVKTDEEYISFEPVLQPVIFERKENEIPNFGYFIKPIKPILLLRKFFMNGMFTILIKAKM